MGFAIIREGDSTSHGGRVLACTATNLVDGRPLALLGDMVSCPKCGGVYPIVDVKRMGMTFDGRPVAFEGDKTACGASLIATQSTATASPTSGPGGSAGGVKSEAYQPNDATSKASYRGRFQVLDDNTRQPVSGHPYTMTAADGRTVQGTTDSNGFTDWLDGHEASSLTFSHPGSEGEA
ncbi:PAAR domain-containing protein [Paraburkholderia terricola]|uniref:Zn-binding Pro-Ala-Ala-Arg (PAAR) domain-containing protein, incolved in TypeVI secretion n=1 Tax=Paraburkholderia terricola TaxID=169427 RepID=A0A1M6Q9L8_9BURK|nr:MULTISPECIES: PAAR domain-containing protein [Paraburkholderia]SDO11737.1 Zn-binding Pro-Ala-Ala-Arg (PAAR) domain-containing protein, incolved in TypeVI secretion [Paraburkholderia sediminicola]SHK16942.1 Zn-binding Pro-Ala-Ala-Arg (PAAR) domain-containing protein, incolved in TypeVI secretion [Paraburkholderia terricola]